ncbi:MAG: Ldh family oxidoreductase, partial [Cytophagaceae bacterium]|nr:Ldh family oxidoreductase [Cytophagaceae bacterium]
DPERWMEEERMANGIPLQIKVREDLIQLAAKFGLQHPF